MSGDNETYSDSFAVEYISKEKNNNKNILANIYRIHTYDSIMCVHFCFRFMMKCKRMLDYTNLFSSNVYKIKYYWNIFNN